ncbi:MAG: hypothetical protein M1479_01440 [Actinobacteria bacterium]|nr:hypothetical protein [Actinomycetota bacterium]
MLYGWVGKIKKIDLSSNDISTIDTSKFIPEFIGGKGISLKIAWDMLKPEIGPFDPENILIFMTGPLTGTIAPTSGRGIISSISPRVYPNPWFTRSNIGGFWAPELKYAGFDGLIITGKSASPIYILVSDGDILFKDARNLWGKGAITTQKVIKEIHGEDVQVLCIGPAGENLIRSSTIQHNLGNASGEAGFGAVMGSKKIKAVVIKGSGEVRIAKPNQFLKDCKYAEELVRNGVNIAGMLNSKVALPTNANCSAACPCNCSWCKARKNVPAKFGSGFLTTVTQCLDYSYSQKWNVSEYDRPEIPDIKMKALPGFNGGIDIHYLLNDLGISEREYMCFYQWFDAFLQVNIEKIKGLELNINSMEFWFNFFRMMTRREGIFDVFAESVMRSADRLEELEIPEKFWKRLKKVAHFLHPAYGFPEHRLGRAFESQPSPIWLFSMLHWAFDTRDPMSNHHQSSFIQYVFPPHHGVPVPLADVSFNKIKKVYEKIFKNGDVIEPGFDPIDGKVKSAIWFQHRSCVIDSLLVCDWVFPRTFTSFKNQLELNGAKDLTGDIDVESRLFSSATGIKMSTQNLEKCGERIYNLERALHIRNYNRCRKIDESIEWICEFPEKSDGTKLNKKIFNRFIDSYYKNRNWNLKNGYPKKQKLKELGLL